METMPELCLLSGEIIIAAVIIAYCIAENFHVVQKFAVFTDRSASAKIKTAKINTSAISIAPHLSMPTGAAIN